MRFRIKKANFGFYVIVFLVELELFRQALKLKEFLKAWRGRSLALVLC